MMSTETTTCILVKCDQCGTYDEHYEYETPVHWPSLEVALEHLTRDVDGLEYQWRFTDETLVCPKCLARERCAEAGGHDWTDWLDGSKRRWHYCQREGCEAHEFEPTPDALRAEGSGK